jgi:hypothetical protein
VIIWEEEGGGDVHRTHRIAGGAGLFLLLLKAFLCILFAYAIVSLTDPCPGGFELL